MPAVLPSGLESFVDKVLPILWAGLFPTDYEASTLRRHYGLARPAALDGRYSPIKAP
jgi:hypothetical protein